MLYLADLKKQHRTVFCTEIAGFRIFFRLLSWREYDTYTKIFLIDLVPRGKIEDRIFREVVLDNSLIDEMNSLPPGIVSSIATVAMALSGNPLQTEDDMGNVNKGLQTARTRLDGDVYEQMIMLICKAFPTMLPNNVEELTFPEVLRMAVMAERILGLETPIEIKPAEKKTLFDKLFKDKSEAERVDIAPPPKERIDEILGKVREGANAPPQLAEWHERKRQEEVIKRVQERRMKNDNRPQKKKK